MGQVKNFNGSLPAPPAGKVNIQWQADPISADPTVVRNVSAYDPIATATAEGNVPTPPNDATKFLDGTAAFDSVRDSDLATSDITTNNVSTAKHGFAPKAPNDATKFLDGTGAYSTPASGGSGSDISKSITQTAHGFAVGNAVYYTGSAWAKAKADANTTLGIAIVSVVTDANNFTAMFAGYISGLSSLSAGYYFVDPSTAGALTATEPTSTAQFSNPILYALSASTGIVLPWRASAVQTSTSPTVTGTKTANYNAAAQEIVMVDPSGGGFTVTLPSAAAVGAGVPVTVKNITSSVNTMTLGRTGSDTIDTSTSITFAGAFSSVTLFSDGSAGWWIK